MKSVRLLFCALLVATPHAVKADPITALIGATVIDGTGKDAVKDAVIVIDGRKIVAVGPRASVKIPAGAREVNVAGKYIIPGLMDANVHLVLGSAIEFIVRYEGHYEDLIEEAAQISLKNGLTTV